MPLFSSVTPWAMDWSSDRFPINGHHCSGVYWATGLLGPKMGRMYALSMIAKTRSLRIGSPVPPIINAVGRLPDSIPTEPRAPLDPAVPDIAAVLLASAWA